MIPHVCVSPGRKGHPGDHGHRDLFLKRGLLAVRDKKCRSLNSAVQSTLLLLSCGRIRNWLWWTLCKHRKRKWSLL